MAGGKSGLSARSDKGFIRLQLSWVLTKRLRHIESRILEVEIWKDSVFYDFLIGARMGQDLDPDEASKTALHYAEVLRELEDPSDRPNEDAITFLVESVMRKVCSAAFQRLKELGARLNMSEAMVDRTWHVVEHVFGAEDRYRLLGGRNMDLALLCTGFAVARVSDVYLTFNEIFGVYARLPCHTPEALGEVPLQGERTGDVVMFYNEVFLPAVKGFIAEEIGSVGCVLHGFSKTRC